HGVLFVIFMIVFFVGMFGYNEIAKKDYLPDAASIHGAEVDSLFWISMIVILIAFVITNILLFVFPYLYAYKEGKKGYFYPDNHTIERIWTIVPAIVLVILLFSGLKLWTNITQTEAPANATIIEVMGKQFAWQVRYPGNDNKLGEYNFRRIDPNNEFGIKVEDKSSQDDFIPRELHFQKGNPVLLKIRARDVIHSVFLPHFRVKMDAVPGMQTSFLFTPTISTSEMRAKTGDPEFNYELACTEVCGRGHFAMRFLVVVDEPAEYKKWLASQKSWKSQNEDYFAETLKKVTSGPKKTETKVHKDELSSL
ncbi:MAG: cytochrome c oxidase subunit II, partial [Opitutaceae bacterium]|nr:cytochrome c oxidase subunit II [Cytophagales bacterium]